MTDLTLLMKLVKFENKNLTLIMLLLLKETELGS